MKLALVSLLSLVCVQVLYGASVPRSSDDQFDTSEDLSLVRDLTEDGDSLYSVKLALEETGAQYYSYRASVQGCLNVVKEVGKLGVAPLKFLLNRGFISGKYWLQKRECKKLATPEEQQKCVDDVDKRFNENVEQLARELREMHPIALNTALELMRCING